MLPASLLDGYHSFLRGRFQRDREAYEELAENGQNPDIMVISCCDSRVSPTNIFATSPGELFILRNVANLVPPYQPDGEYHGTSAALEYAVDVLQVRHIVVLGHAQCGGIAAFARQNLAQAVGQGAAHPSGQFIGRWMSLIDPILGDASGKPGTREYARSLELAAIKLSLQNLMSFPNIRSRVEQGSLALHGAFFGIATGNLYVLDEESGEFRLVER